MRSFRKHFSGPAVPTAGRYARRTWALVRVASLPVNVDTGLDRWSCGHCTRDLGKLRNKLLRTQSHTLWLPVLSQGHDLQQLLKSGARGPVFLPCLPGERDCPDALHPWRGKCVAVSVWPAHSPLSLPTPHLQSPGHMFPKH